MRPYFVWTILIIFSVGILWQLQISEPVLSPLAAGLLLLFFGMIAGLRWGADSAAACIREMGLLNRYLAEQNRDLADMNHLLLKRTLLELEFEEETPHSTHSEEAS